MNPSPDHCATPRRGRWWIGLLAGNMAYSFIRHPEFLHFPERVRRKAARRGLAQSFRHWQCWAALLLMIAATAGLSAIDSALQISDRSGTAGAALGFLLGLTVLQWTVYTYGLGHYVQALKENPPK